MPFKGGGGIGGPRTRKGAPKAARKAAPPKGVGPVKSGKKYGELRAARDKKIPTGIRRGGALHEERRKVGDAVRRAEQAVVNRGGSPTIKAKRYPKLPSYTKKQRDTIVREQGNSVRSARREYQRKYGAKALNELDERGGFRKLADRETRRQLKLLERSVKSKTADDRATTGARILREADVDLKKVPRDYKIKVAKEAEQRQRERDGELKAGKPKEKYKLTDTVKVAGIAANPVSLVRNPIKSADKLLKELQRPTSAVIGAADAVKRGKNPAKGAVENFKTNKLSGSDLVGKGVSPTARAVIGLGIDVAVDPLNLATFGASAPAKTLSKGAERAASAAKEVRAAAKAAKNAEESSKLIEKAKKLEVQADKLHERAKTASKNKGVQAGVRLPGGKTIKTSGEATAALSRVTGVSKAATKVRQSKVGQTIGKLSPGFRPAGVSERDWEHYRAAQRRARSRAGAGRDKWHRYGLGINKDLRKAAKASGIAVKEARTKATDAIERAQVSRGARTDPSGPQTHSMAALAREHPELHKVASQLKSDMKRMGREEVKRGQLAELRSDYLTHIPTKAFRKELDREAKSNRRGTGRNPYAKGREHEGAISDIEADLPTDKPMFTRNLGKIASTRGGKHEYLKAHNDLAREVGTIARPYRSMEDLRPADAVFVKDRHGNLKATEMRGGKVKATLKDGDELVVMPRAIGDAVVRGPIHAVGRIKGLDKLTQAAKTALTTFNMPAYQLRNLAGDLWFSYQADTRPQDVAEAFGLAHRVHYGANKRARKSAMGDASVRGGDVKLAHGVTKTRDEFLAELREQGIIGTGHLRGEFDERAKTLRKGGDEAEESARGSRRSFVEGVRAAGQPLEDGPRIATYLSARRRGLTPDEAADWVAKHHIDYGDLSDTEKAVLRRVFPFYTFLSRNTVNQARSLARRPGKFANYGMVIEEGRKQAGLDEDWQEKLPDYYRRGLPIPVKVGDKQVKLLFPQLPITDINRIIYAADPKEQTDLLLQSLNPIVKVLAEDRLNYSFFFRGPIRQDDDNPQVSRWTPAPAWTKALPAKARQVLAGGDKEAADAGLWTKRADYWFRVLPATNTVTQATTSKVGSRNQSAKDVVLSLSGTKVNNWTPEKFDLDKLYDQRAKLDRKIKDAKDLGRDHTALDAARELIQDQIDAASPDETKSYGLGKYGGSSGSGGLGKYDTSSNGGLGKYGGSSGSGGLGKYGD